MKKYLYVLFATGLLIAGVLLTTPVHKAYAVDIFNRCTTQGGGGANCADCSTGSKGGAPPVSSSATCKDATSQSKSSTNPVITVLRAALTVVSIIAGIAAIIMLIVAGLRFILSNGDASGIKAARESVIYSIIGIIVVIMSQSIVVYVLNKIK